MENTEDDFDLDEWHKECTGGDASQPPEKAIVRAADTPEKTNNHLVQTESTLGHVQHGSSQTGDISRNASTNVVQGHSAVLQADRVPAPAENILEHTERSSLQAENASIKAKNKLLEAENKVLKSEILLL